MQWPLQIHIARSETTWAKEKIEIVHCEACTKYKIPAGIHKQMERQILLFIYAIHRIGFSQNYAMLQYIQQENNASPAHISSNNKK